MCSYPSRGRHPSVVPLWSSDPPSQCRSVWSCMLSLLFAEFWSVTARLQVRLAVRFWQGNALQLAFQRWRRGITLQQHEQQQVSQVRRSCCAQQLSPRARQQQ